MKKIIILLFLLSSFTQLNAQSVNGISVEDIPAKYVEIVAQPKMFKIFQVTIYLDYGQIGKMKDVKKGRIMGEDGRSMTFNGVMGALNILTKKGFNYVSQYLDTSGGNNVYHILLENTNYKEKE